MKNELAETERQSHWSNHVVIGSFIVLAATMVWNYLEKVEYDQMQRDIVCSEPVFQFSPTFVGNTIEHIFRISNAGDLPAKVERVVAECGCTTVGRDLVGVEISSHGSLEIPVSLKVPEEDDGEFEKKVYVRFSGEPYRRIILTVKGMVEPRWKIAPQTVQFQNLRPDESRSQTVSLEPHTALGQMVISGVSTSSLLKASLVETVSKSGNHIWQLTVSTVPPLPPGRSTGRIWVHNAEDRQLDGPQIPVTLIVDRESDGE